MIPAIAVLSCNSAYRLRYWNITVRPLRLSFTKGRCNSAYRLRYWNNRSVSSNNFNLRSLQQCLPFTVLKRSILTSIYTNFSQVATVLTVYGIETVNDSWSRNRYCQKLQQCLPFTVLKLYRFTIDEFNFITLQQCLPFTVLKRTSLLKRLKKSYFLGCNSAYRLRYWNFFN